MDETVPQAPDLDSLPIKIDYEHWLADPEWISYDDWRKQKLEELCRLTEEAEKETERLLAVLEDRRRNAMRYARDDVARMESQENQRYAPDVREQMIRILALHHKRRVPDARRAMRLLQRKMHHSARARRLCRAWRRNTCRARARRPATRTRRRRIVAQVRSTGDPDGDPESSDDARQRLRSVTPLEAACAGGAP